MYSFETLFFSIASALLVGAVSALLAYRHWSADSRKQRELQNSLDLLTQQQREYRGQVMQHFSDTATLLNKLTESYRDVHNQLASGARTLTDGHPTTLLQPLPEPESTAAGDPASPVSVRQPLDYAPKSYPYERGMLNEEFGLEKSASNEPRAVLVDTETGTEPGRR